MKLTSALVERTLSQIDAEAIPDNHPAIAQLNRLFGEHTFFIDDNGLNIVEPAEPAAGGTEVGKIVNVASWNEADPPTLSPHDPEPTDVVVVLRSTH